MIFTHPVLLAECHINKNFNKVTRPVLLRQQTLPWRPITIAITLTCPQDRLLKT